MALVNDVINARPYDARLWRYRFVSQIRILT